MSSLRFHRRVHVTFNQQLEDDSEMMTGDLMLPEPDLAADIVGVLLNDWTITSVEITAENSITEDDEDKDAEGS